jgi:hypothetical protein
MASRGWEKETDIMHGRQACCTCSTRTPRLTGNEMARLAMGEIVGGETAVFGSAILVKSCMDRRRANSETVNGR